MAKSSGVDSGAAKRNSTAANEDAKDVNPAPADDAITAEFLETLVGYHIRRAQITTFREFSASVDNGKFSPPLFSVLSLVSENPGSSQAALADFLEVDRPAVLALVDRLEDRGLLTRERSKSDRRRQALFLTRKGESEYERLCQEVTAQDRRLAQKLTAAQRRRLAELLEQIWK